MAMMNLFNTVSSAKRSARGLRLATLALLLGGAAFGAMAQYKIVGPDGKVTYTDKPPTPSDIRIDNGATAGPGTAATGMPYETRQAMGKYPVILYATKNCAACDMARDALKNRGVPFNEYSITMDADIEALKARFGNGSLPVIAIGSQTMKGYSSNDLQGYLDAAGYPAQAKLTGYRWPPAVALAPPAPAQTAAANRPAAAASAPAPLLPPASKNGIQF